jgi:hypothetical protein
LLSLLLLLLLLCDVVPDQATGGGACNRMMARQVPGHGTYRRSLDATLCFGRLRSREQQHSQERHR